MFRPASLFIGLRYIRAKRKSHFISFMSCVSMLGIALGVMVLIMVLSVMNGFDQEIKKRIFSMISPITLTDRQGILSDWATWQQRLKKQSPDILAVAPFVNGEALLNSEGIVQPVIINGILPEQEKQVIDIGNKMIHGRLDALQAKKFGIVLGEVLARRLHVRLTDQITVMTPQLSFSMAGMMPRFKRFHVVGIFKAGDGFGFDTGLAFIHLTDAKALFGLGSNISGLHLKIRTLYDAPYLAKVLTMQFKGLSAITWADQFGAFFHAVKLEKTMMFFILMLIIAVAAFNLVSMLVMVVFDKAADIAILRTIGATSGTIMAIFVVQGAMIGIIGTVLGVFGGVALAWNVTSIVNDIQHIFHVQFLSSSVYFVNYLPSHLEWLDVWQVSSVACLLSLLATLYPAWRAASLDPVKALCHE